MGDSDEEIARDIEAISHIEAVPTLLQVLCEMTGMGFAAVARVTDENWTACAVQDNIQFGLVPGGQLDVATTLCREVRSARVAIAIDQASADPLYRNHPTPRTYQIESYVSVPIILRDGRYFGNLCAIDPRPARVKDPKIMSMFNRFAQLIALQLETELAIQGERAALLDERAAGELREQFIAILGHDLRNPLQAFFAGCDLLARKVRETDSLAIVSRMKANARRMSALIDDVLDFARARLGGGIGVRPAAVDDVDDALKAVVSELRDARPERTILSDIDVHRTVRCDMGRVQQVASNLLSNALTHGAENVPVKFDAKVVGGELIIEVWNGGEPIAADNLKRIFEPFWRRTTSSTREGLGLGLHICAQIVGAHNGQLTVTSTQAGGTQFTARLPCGN
jgi:signal transduction histidine kinase